MTDVKKIIVTLSVALAVSLAGNAFLGGMVMSRHMGPPPFADRLGPPDGPDGGPDEHDGPMRGGIRAFMRDLPADVRGPIAQSFKDNRAGMVQSFRDVMQARQAASDALTAEPFDAEKLRVALANQRQVQSAVQAKVHEQLITVISQFTPEQRAELADQAKKLFR